ncbi:hypothetical protein GA0115252_15113 [Streptomyces sp. DfronAA-171]|nr:hypothetical protein GA0115252_15113 [Streptomyces sp. DfronAA-171]
MPGPPVRLLSSSRPSAARSGARRALGMPVTRRGAVRAASAAPSASGVPSADQGSVSGASAAGAVPGLSTTS